jgi:hypothetical protein
LKCCVANYGWCRIDLKGVNEIVQSGLNDGDEAEVDEEGAYAGPRNCSWGFGQSGRGGLPYPMNISWADPAMKIPGGNMMAPNIIGGSLASGTGITLFTASLEI